MIVIRASWGSRTRFRNRTFEAGVNPALTRTLGCPAQVPVQDLSRRRCPVDEHRAPDSAGDIGCAGRASDPKTLEPVRLETCWPIQAGRILVDAELWRTSATG